MNSKPRRGGISAAQMDISLSPHFLDRYYKHLQACKRNHLINISIFLTDERMNKGIILLDTFIENIYSERIEQNGKTWRHGGIIGVGYIGF